MNNRLRVSAADRALEALQDPQRLERARARFSASPPYYRSLSTDSDATEPDVPPGGIPGVHRVDEPETLGDKRIKLNWQRLASMPRQLFELEYNHKAGEIYDARPYYNPYDGISEMERLEAQEIIKQRWIEQGIWRDEWHRPGGGFIFADNDRWKHENLIEDFAPDTGSEAHPPVSLFGGPDSTPKQPKSDDEIRRLRREREASRPFHQFIYQVSIERQQILDGAKPNAATSSGAAIHEETSDGATSDGAGPDVVGSTNATPPDTDDISSKAYEIVKAKWTEFGIWKKTWSVLPGISWKHEHSLEDLLRVELPEALASGPLYPKSQPPDIDTQTTDVRNGSRRCMLSEKLTDEEQCEFAEQTQAKSRPATEASPATEARRQAFTFGRLSPSDGQDGSPSCEPQPGERLSDESGPAKSADNASSRESQTSGGKRKADDEPLEAEETYQPKLFRSWRSSDGPNHSPLFVSRSDKRKPEAFVQEGPADQVTPDQPATADTESPLQTAKTRKKSRANRQQQSGNKDSGLPPNDKTAVAAAEPEVHHSPIPEVSLPATRRQSSRLRKLREMPANDPPHSARAQRRPKRADKAGAGAGASPPKSAAPVAAAEPQEVPKRKRGRPARRRG